MIINSFQNSSTIKTNSAPKSFKGTTVTVDKQELPSDLSKITADTLKAYNGLSSIEEYVSKETLFDYLREKNFKREDLFEQIAESLADKNGQISQNAFEFFKNFQDKNYPIICATKVFDASKEDGKINYNALMTADKLVKKTNLHIYNRPLDIATVLDKAKNKDGSFNKDVLEIISNNADILKKIFEVRPNHFFNILKNNANEFSKINIDYVKKRALENVDILKILGEIASAKNQNGDFSLEVKQLKEYINSTFDMWSQNLVASIAFSFSENEKAKLTDFLQFAESYKNERDFPDILSFIKDKKLDENDKSLLGYSKESFDFVNEMLKASYGDKDKLDIILKKLGCAYNKIPPQDLEVLKKMCSIIEKNDVETFIDAATYKAGNKKGQFSTSNLAKYLDIYSKNKFYMSVDDIRHIAGCLELEEDDEALTLLQKLHNQRWKTDSQIYNKEDLLKKTNINEILELLCLEVEGRATRPCLKGFMKNISKLFEMRLPMSSKDAFTNFMLIQDFAVIDKLQKVNFEELGINTGEVTCGIFKKASEEQLLQFKEFLKDYLKDKSAKNINIELNRNIASIVELTTGNQFNNAKLLYDFEKGHPVTELKTQKFGTRQSKSQKDFQNNTVTTQLFDIKKEGPYEIFEIPVLKEQTFEKYDKDGQLVFKETMEKSTVDNVFNIRKIYADGKVENICNAIKTKDGNDIVEKHLESLEGTKTDYRYEDDPQGNRIVDYKITDKNGKVLMNTSITFEVIDENHFVSSRNDKKFDIQVSQDSLVVKNLKNGKTAIIDLINFTNDSKEKMLPVLKQIPGDELFTMQELDLKSFCLSDKVSNAAFAPKLQSIFFTENYLDTAVALHEWGHAKDELVFKEIDEDIYKDKKLNDIYNKEKEAFRKHFGDAQLDFIGYFSADYHYLGSKKAIKEGIAETNTLLNVYPKNDTQSIRAHYWQQFFPRTIAYLSNLLF